MAVAAMAATATATTPPTTAERIWPGFTRRSRGGSTRGRAACGSAGSGRGSPSSSPAAAGSGANSGAFFGVGGRIGSVGFSTVRITGPPAAGGGAGASS